MKKLILDYSKWICGGGIDYNNRINATGQGRTELLNEMGYMCCLGQFTVQLDLSLEIPIKEITMPHQLNKEIPLLTEYSKSLENLIVDSNFSVAAITINDVMSTTIEYKLKALTDLCMEYGYELEVINKPE